MNIKDLKLRNKTCLLNNKEQYTIENAMGMYIVADRKCNASCEFCEFRNGVSEVDLDKLKETIIKLYKMFGIPTIHITGGEPTLDLVKLKGIVNIIKEINNSIHISVNTNGINLNKLVEIDINNIALSRHGLTDEENFEIFGTDNIAKEKDIKKFPKSKLHLSCNLIRGHVDSEIKVREYLNKYGNLGVFDVGFVSLMKVNKYCEDSYIGDEIFNNFKSSRHYKLIDNGELKCECRNYLYTTDKNKLVSFYKRGVIQRNFTETSYLVYENNRLRNGFGGEYIEI